MINDMIIEQNTNYAYKLKYMENPTFDKVRDLAIKFMRELPKQLQDELYEALNRGIDILDSEPQMVTYLYAFGPMHQAKLNYAFKHLPKEFLEQPEINIIDYGCGQALGTMCYADFLHDNGYAQQVKTITLIEPSEMCLKRAALHASMFFPNAEIKTVNKTFDELIKDDIYCDEDIPTLHILSNVLDILDFDLEGFAELINGQVKGYNQFVCVGPYFNYSDNDNRMDEFCSILNGNDYYWDYFDKYEFEEDKAWTAQILCFDRKEWYSNIVKECGINGSLEYISTDFSKEDCNDGFFDEYGVLYSNNGEKLLISTNFELETYSIKDGTRIICCNAFSSYDDEENRALKKIVIPDTVEIIGSGAFVNCSFLKSISLSKSSSIAVIEDYAFTGCSSLHQITIPKSIKHIGRNPFTGCNELFLNSLCPRYLVRDGFVFDNCNGQCSEIIAYIGKDKYVEIPDSVTFINESTFSHNHFIQQIIIPNSVTWIGDGAFSFCESLNQIIIPNTIHRIGYSTFYKCKSLQKITIPNSVISIEKWAFSDCPSLKQIIIPEGSKEKFKSMFSKELWEKLVEQ
jgi:hypothetical protein